MRLNGNFPNPASWWSPTRRFHRIPPSLPQPSQLQALIPGRESAAGAVQQPCYLSLSHTQREQQHHGRPRNGSGRKNPTCPSQCCSSQVLFQVIPTAQPSKERGFKLSSAHPALAQLPQFPPRTRGWQRKEEEAARDLPQLPAKQQPPSGVCCCTSKKKTPEISQNLPLAWVGGTLKII